MTRNARIKDCIITIGARGAVQGLIEFKSSCLMIHDWGYSVTKLCHDVKLCIKCGKTHVGKLASLVGRAEDALVGNVITANTPGEKESIEADSLNPGF